MTRRSRSHLFGDGGGGGAVPVNSTAPTLSPTSAAVSILLTCTTGTWTNSPTSYAYQWMRNGVDRAGFTSSTYTTVAGDDGFTITCKVRASNATGPAAAYVTTSNSCAVSSGGGAVFEIADSIFNEDLASPYTATMPAVVDADDLLILIAHRASGSSVLSGTPAGWTSLASAGDYALYYKWAVGTEDGTSVAVSATGTPVLFFTVLRITGADPAQNPQLSVAVSGSSTVPNPGSVDPSWADANNLFIAVATTDDAVAVSAYPSGYALNQASNVGTTGSSGVAAKASTSSAAENPGTFTFAGSADWYAFTLAVKGLA